MLEILTGPHAAVGEVVTGDDLVLVHLRQHPGLPQVRDEDARAHAQGDPVPVVVNQLPQILLAHLLQVPALRNDALSGHAGRLSQRKNSKKEKKQKKNTEYPVVPPATA